MARMSKADKAIEAVVEAGYRKHGNNVQVNIFDIGKVMDAGRDAAKAGQSVDEAMIAAFAQYRKN